MSDNFLYVKRKKKILQHSNASMPELKIWHYGRQNAFHDL